MLTYCCNICRIVYRVNLQHNSYWFTHLAYILLLHYLGENLIVVSELAQKVCQYKWDNQAAAVWNSEANSSGLMVSE